MLDIKGEELMVRSDCKKSHEPDDANILKNEYGQRYYEFKCGCTQVYGSMARPTQTKRRSNIARGVNQDSFVAGMFKSDFDL